MKHQFFVHTQLNDQTVLYQTIQFSISHYLFALSLNVKQFYLTHRLNSFRCYHSGLGWTRKQWQWRGILHSPKLQHYRSFTIRLFCVISRTLVGEVLHLCRDAVSVFYSPSWLGWERLRNGRRDVFIDLIWASLSQWLFLVKMIEQLVHLTRLPWGKCCWVRVSLSVYLLSQFLYLLYNWYRIELHAHWYSG